MTERIYYGEPARRTFDAVVTRALEYGGRPAVHLDRTAFYPTSGGQPFDTGRLGDVNVVEAVDEDEGVVHVLSAPIAEGAAVHGDIDWPRRFDHMQQHTGQHVLSAAFDRLFDNRTTSFHMGADSATIDLAREMTAVEVERAADEANRVVWEDRPVSIRMVSAEEAATLPLRKEPARSGPLRLIEIADFDLSACGGTHVARTGEIGIIAVSAVERFRGGSRLTFLCGGRVLRAFRLQRDALAGSVRHLSVLPHELPAAIERMQHEHKQARKDLARLQQQLAVHEASRLLTHARDVNGVRVVVEALDGWDAVGLRAIASGLTAHERVATALFTSTAPIAATIARSSDVSLDANALLRAMMATFGGRGGGKPDFAQGAGLTGNVADVVDAARTALTAALR
ncbi:MAG TPA: DHHA1 domain-containing protein [Vicinamibacterales bacterium]|nr:DHHA1 domain-containing protein [Vicinamibacterales bacterium]